MPTTIHRPAAAAALFIAFACSDDPAASTADSGVGAPPGATWSDAFDTSAAGALSGVWGSAPDDIWMVGGTPTQGEAWHFDGTDWRPVLVPEGLGLLVWVYGFSPDNAFAVGVDGAAARWDGVAWTALDTGTDQDLWGVWGAAPDDIWVVGGDADTGVPLILHFDGDRFSETPLDAAENPNGATTVFKVFGVDDRAFIVGQRGLILEYTDGHWRYRDAGPDADQDFVSLTGADAAALVAVGGRGNARIATLDGDHWQTLAPSGVGGLNAVSQVSDTHYVVGGVNGYVGVFDRSTGTLTQEASLTTDDLHAAWSDGAGRTWMVGGHFYAPYTGVAFVREDAP